MPAADPGAGRLASEAERRRAFRAWVRAHHPDVGGDPAVFAAGIQAWRAPVGRSAGEGVFFFRRRRGLARWVTRRQDRHARAGRPRVI